MNYSTARRVADEILESLAPHCLRIEVKGSVCRVKVDDIHDIEIVCIPKPRTAPPAFGETPYASPLHAYTDGLLQLGLMAYRKDKNGRRAWGDKFRRALWRSTPLDLFITTAEQWGVIATIRTGSAAFSHKLVTPAVQGGWMPIGMRVELGRLWHGTMAIETPEEADFFEAIGLPWVEPIGRNLEVFA